MSLNRRQFIISSSLLAGGLALGFSLSGCARQDDFPGHRPAAFHPNAYLQITPAGEIILQVHKLDMGQSVATGFATIVAEELGVHPGDITLEFAPVYSGFADADTGLMVTGGSSSISKNFDILRVAGATVRELLLTSAALQANVDVSQCMIDGLSVTVRGEEKSRAFSELLETAKTLPVPENPALKPVSSFRYIGHYNKRVEVSEKAGGSLLYAIDMDLPEMLVAVVLRCPHIGGAVASYDASLPADMPEVKFIGEIASGIAVVAKGYWHARKAADRLQVNWLPAPSDAPDSVSILARQRELLRTADGKTIRDDGDYSAVNGAAKITSTLMAEYAVPYLAHATMEPQNAVVWASEEKCDVWAPNQGPDVVRDVVATVLSLPREKVIVHSTWMGGGFGRRIHVDYVAETAEISLLTGKPIKLIWSREDDIRHDFYRPSSLAQLRAELTGEGEIYSWYHKIVAPSILRQALPVYAKAALPAWVPQTLSGFSGDLVKNSDFSSYEGAEHLPYTFANVKVDYVFWDPGVRVGFWRSVGHSYNAFVVESFVDELAHAVSQDPYQFRRRHLSGRPRHLRVLDRVAKESGWVQKKQGEDGRFRGIAVHESFDTYVAQVVEVSIVNDEVKVQRIVSAVDCGLRINPDIVRDQIEGAIIFALTAALKGEITFSKGEVEQSNFHDYPLLRMNQTPDIEVHIINSSEAASGIGEPGVPPVAPALANAVFLATGKRLRSLPLDLS